MCFKEFYPNTKIGPFQWISVILICVDNIKQKIRKDITLMAVLLKDDTLKVLN